MLPWFQYRLPNIPALTPYGTAMLVVLAPSSVFWAFIYTCRWRREVLGGEVWLISLLHAVVTTFLSGWAAYEAGLSGLSAYETVPNNPLMALTLMFSITYFAADTVDGFWHPLFTPHHVLCTGASIATLSVPQDRPRPCVIPSIPQYALEPYWRLLPRSPSHASVRYYDKYLYGLIMHMFFSEVGNVVNHARLSGTLSVLRSKWDSGYTHDPTEPRRNLVWDTWYIVAGRTLWGVWTAYGVLYRMVFVPTPWWPLGWRSWDFMGWLTIFGSAGLCFGNVLFSIDMLQRLRALEMGGAPRLQEAAGKSKRGKAH